MKDDVVIFLCADDFDAEMMANGEERARRELELMNEKKKDGTISPKEENLIPILEICIEMYSRGINFSRINLYKSAATDFLPTDDGNILPPLNALQGIGSNAARSIVEEREKGSFKTVSDLKIRTGITKTVAEILENYGCFANLPEPTH